MSLMPKIVRGSAMHVLEQIVRLGCALWITPRMVHFLGEAGFGLWGLLAAIFSQFILLDLGLCSTLPRFLSRAIGRGDEQDIRETASTGAVGMVVIGILAQIAGGITWLALPYFLAANHDLDEARAVVLALMLGTLAFWIGRPIMLHMQSRLRRDLIGIAAIIRVLICTPAVAWALDHDMGLVAVAWIHSLGAIGELVLYALFDRSFFRLVRWPWVHLRKARELLLFARWSYVLTTSERVRNAAADLFIVAAFLGSAASGVYSLGQKLAFMFHDFAYSVVGAQLLSAFSHLDGAGERKGLENGFLAASRISVQLAVIGGGMLCAVGPVFLQRWVPAQAAQATPILLLLIFPNMLCVAQIPARHLLMSLAKHRPLAITYLIGIIGNVILTVILVKSIGMLGAALAAFVEMTLLHAIAMPWLVVSQTGMSWRLVAWESLWRPLMRSTAVLAPAFFLAHHWASQPDYVQILVAIVSLSALFFVSLALGFLGREEKAWLKLGWQILFRSKTAQTEQNTLDKN